MAAYLDIALDIAREAGSLLSSYARQNIGFELKGEYDLVTEADRASERLAIERLRERFPSHDIVAEEGGGRMSGAEYRWYVDPLDGTTNFAHSFPVYNVTMALERAGELLAGVIYDPTRDEMFAAERGGGATLNGARIRVSAAERLEDALVATGFPSRKRHQSVNIHFYYQLAMTTHGVRRAGSAAIDLAYVACGRLDAFWEFKLNPWDMAAGILIVQEAGGLCSDMHGRPVALDGPHILADNGKVHGEILSRFRDVFDGKFAHSLPELPD